MIETRSLYFKYESDLVLKNISLSIKEGTFTAIIGSNGSGKTTLAKHLNGLLIPAKGDVLVDGISTKKNEVESRKKVGFVFQNFEDQIVHSIVEEDVAFGLENLELPHEDIVRKVGETLKRLGLGGIAKRNVNMLSLGQKQLVALAGVLAMKPKYIVFDEPTTMLDTLNKRNIMNIIRMLNKKEHITIILVTNILDDLRYADKVIVLKEGSVIFDGAKTKLSGRLLKRAGLYE